MVLDKCHSSNTVIAKNTQKDAFVVIFIITCVETATILLCNSVSVFVTQIYIVFDISEKFTIIVSAILILIFIIPITIESVV